MIKRGQCRLIADHPDRFGASPRSPPTADAGLAELAYALDELALDGVVLTSNLAGHYLGDPSSNRCWPNWPAGR